MAAQCRSSLFSTLPPAFVICAVFSSWLWVPVHFCSSPFYIHLPFLTACPVDFKWTSNYSIRCKDDRLVETAESASAGSVRSSHCHRSLGILSPGGSASPLEPWVIWPVIQISYFSYFFREIWSPKWLHAYKAEPGQKKWFFLSNSLQKEAQACLHPDFRPMRHILKL